MIKSTIIRSKYQRLKLYIYIYIYKRYLVFDIFISILSLVE